MKKILFVLQLPPPVHGTSVVNEFILKSNSINSEFNTQFNNLSTAGSIDSIGKYSTLKVWKALGILYSIIKDLFRFKPDLVYYTFSPTGPSFYRDLLFCLVIKLLNYPLILHLHGKGFRSFLDKKIKQIAINTVFKNSYVISLSKGLVHDIEHLPFRKNYVLNNGIPVKTSERNPTHNPTRLLFLSNLVESKGILILMEALKIVSLKNTDWALRIVGNEADLSFEQIRKKIAEANLQANVEVRGPKYGDEKITELSWADLMIFPTFYDNECFPLVILEAMLHGLPVISTYEGAIAEIITPHQTGLLVQQRDVEQLTEAILTVLQNPDLIEQWSMRSKEVFHEKYRLEIFEEGLVQIFKDVFIKK